MSDAIGLDIGSYAIKLARAKKGFNSTEITHLASAYNPTGQVIPTDEGVQSKLATAIKQLLSEQKLGGRPVHVTLPESLAYTNIISMPVLSEAELASSIHWEAEQHIPVPLDTVNLEYDILYKPGKEEVGEKMRVLLVAAPRETVEKFVDIIHKAGLEVVGMETTLLSIYRALKPSLVAGGASIICHLGALSSDVVIVDNGNMVLSYSVQTGGLALTRAIEQGLGLPANQAEEYKRAYGLNPQQLEGKVRNAMTGVMNIIIGEVRKAIQYHQSSNMMNPVRSMVLSGGSAYLPGLTSYFAEAFSLEVVIGNPLGAIPTRSGLTAPDNLAAFNPAIGLALQSES